MVIVVDREGNNLELLALHENMAKRSDRLRGDNLKGKPMGFKESLSFLWTSCVGVLMRCLKGLLSFIRTSSLLSKLIVFITPGIIWFDSRVSSPRNHLIIGGGLPENFELFKRMRKLSKIMNYCRFCNDYDLMRPLFVL